MNSASPLGFSFTKRLTKSSWPKLGSKLLTTALLFVSSSVSVACGGANSSNHPTPPSPPATPVAATPTFSPAGGTYASAQTVTISTTTPVSSIYHTSDGDTPTTSSARHTAPVPVGTTQTLKAIAAAPGYTNSSIATATYTISSSGTTGSGLPVVAACGVPKPSGTVGNLKVLDWAGLKGAITYTFDDGLASQVANYSQLHATGIHMTFFLNLNAGNAATWTQAAKEGNELGNHTAHHCHADGTGCAGTYAGSLEAEYDLCTDYIKQTYGVGDVWTTATPYGDTGYDDVAKTRFFLNRGVRAGLIGPNDNTDPYNLLIYGAAAGDTASVFDSHIDSARSAGKWQIFLFHSLGGDGGFAPVNAADVIDSINHAKSGGDVWIDSMVNIGAYWAGQKAVTNATRTQSGTDTTITWTLPAHFPAGKYVRVTVTGGTLKQGGQVLPWNDAGYYEVALDPGSLTISAN